MTGMPASRKEGLAGYSKEQTELLKLLLEKKSRQTQGIRPYPRNEHGGFVRLPISWAQQRLWFMDQLEGQGAPFHIQVAVRLLGTLDRTALQRSLDSLVQRHEVFRTLFRTEEGQPSQLIATEGRIPVEVVDLSEFEESEREIHVRQQKTEAARERFDLAEGPLIRGRLLKWHPQAHLLVLTIHHIICDGWSIGVLIRDLSELYRAYRESRGNPLSPLPIQYADYAQWQRQWLNADLLQKQIGYWRTHLDGAAPELGLPTDRPRPSMQSFRGGHSEIVFDAGLSARLKQLAQRLEMTLFMVLYGGWALLLSRLSGQDDVVIGTPVANRRRPELEGLIGCFVNTLVLRVAVEGDLHATEYLRHIKEVTLAAYDHQDVPFERVVEMLRPERSLARHPVFQVMLALQNAPKTDLRLPGLAAALEDGANESSMFDLMLSLEEQGEHIRGSVGYATDLFDPTTIEMWMACYEVLLRSLTETMDKPIGELPILPDEQWYRVVRTFNDTRLAVPREKLIHQLFEEQVRRTPKSTAVVFDTEILSYGELNNRANQLACYLRERGVGPETLVGLCLERSVHMIVGMLGILKAGGAYVPLDPSYPIERLQYMLSDARPRILITQTLLQERLSSLAEEVLAIDGECNEISRRPVQNLESRSMAFRSRQLAYVIYTSGSTGRPKGVMVEHASVVNFLTSMQDSPGITSTDRLLAVTTVSFDIAALEIFLPLFKGAQIIMASREAACDGQALIEMLERFDVTVLQATPATWQMLLGGGWNGQRGLKALCGGEALTTELSGELLKRVGELWNLYGPTETTIWSCRRQISKAAVEGSAVESIGRPIANTSVHILDRLLQPLPIGVAGEIHIGGAGVARGYLNRPELTAERFIADPFGSDPQARLYKTGDLGRWRADGALEYLGRNDSQVKIRGYRIELGEIEAQLSRHPRVKAAVVIVREDIPGDKRLVAYVTLVEQCSSVVEELSTHLKMVLPDYMVPSAFVILIELPLTANAKIDRRALPAPEAGAYATAQHETPQGEVEETLAQIWKDLLHVDQVGRQSNFFELGGHSLHGTRMLVRINERFGVRLPLHEVFQHPTIRQMAEGVERLLRAATGAPNPGEMEFEEGAI